MLTERNLWRGATAAAIGILLLLMLQGSRPAKLADIAVHAVVVDPCGSR